MSRSTSFLGTNNQAKKFLDSFGLVPAKRIYILEVEGKEVEREESNIEVRLAKQVDNGRAYEGMFDEQYTLFDHITPDGRVFEERVQLDPWDSGPIVFVSLWDMQENCWVDETLWTKEQIEAYVGEIQMDEPTELL